MRPWLILTAALHRVICPRDPAWRHQCLDWNPALLDAKAHLFQLHHALGRASHCYGHCPLHTLYISFGMKTSFLARPDHSPKPQNSAQFILYWIFATCLLLLTHVSLNNFYRDNEVMGGAKCIVRTHVKTSTSGLGGGSVGKAQEPNDLSSDSQPVMSASSSRRRKAAAGESPRLLG